MALRKMATSVISMHYCDACNPFSLDLQTTNMYVTDGSCFAQQATEQLMFDLKQKATVYVTCLTNSNAWYDDRYEE